MKALVEKEGGQKKMEKEGDHRGQENTHED